MQEPKVSLHRFQRVLAAMCLTAGAASAQLPPPAGLPDFDFNLLLTVPATRVLSESTAPNLSAPLILLRYRFEEIALPFTVQIDSESGTQFYHSAVRVVIAGGPFVIGDQPLVIWIGPDHLLMLQPIPLTSATPSGASEVASIIYDRSILRDGLAIGVNYSFEELDPTDLFPELLHLIP